MLSEFCAPIALFLSGQTQAAIQGKRLMTGSEITMTYSAILRDKQGRRVIRVQFEREGQSGRELAEGILPDGVIQRQNGFSDEEIRELEEYLKRSSDDIFSRAKEISNHLKWL